MIATSLSQIIIPLAAGLSGGGIAAWTLLRRPKPTVVPLEDPDMALLFRGSTLIDATPGVLTYLEAEDGDLSPDLLADVLRTRFPGVSKALTNPRGAEIEGVRPGERLRVSTTYDSTHVAISSAESGNGGALGPISAELDDYRMLARSVSAPVWRTTSAGQIDWANPAYLDLCRSQLGTNSPAWPLPHVFGPLRDVFAPSSGERVSITQDDRLRWFRSVCAPTPGGVVHTAWPDDGAVVAEEALRNFKMALSNTFATLAVGIAIFDARRELMLFNPALTELTGINARHLVCRPGLAEFLDRLREASMLPEPKDYQHWKSVLLGLSRGSGDSLRETWPVGDGRTLRVSAEPHGDGAVAFVFEDITSEIGLTRSFRAELDLSQSVLDALDDAVAVFGPTRQLVTSNAAYAALWGADESQVIFGGPTLDEAFEFWAGRSALSPVWQSMRDDAETRAGGDAWSDPIERIEGSSLQARVKSLPGGSTMVSFRPVPSAPILPSIARNAVHA